MAYSIYHTGSCLRLDHIVIVCQIVINQLCKNNKSSYMSIIVCIVDSSVRDQFCSIR